MSNQKLIKKQMKIFKKEINDDINDIIKEKSNMLYKNVKFFFNELHSHNQLDDENYDYYFEMKLDFEYEYNIEIIYDDRDLFLLKMKQYISRCKYMKILQEIKTYNNECNEIIKKRKKLIILLQFGLPTDIIRYVIKPLL
jgi:hypothetical protein